MTTSHSLHSLEAEKGPISFTFGHTHTGMIDTKSPPRELVLEWKMKKLVDGKVSFRMENVMHIRGHNREISTQIQVEDRVSFRMGILMYVGGIGRYRVYTIKKQCFFLFIIFFFYCF